VNESVVGPSRRFGRLLRLPQLRVKQTCRAHRHSVANDPIRSSAVQTFCIARFLIRSPPRWQGNRALAPSSASSKTSASSPSIRWIMSASGDPLTSKVPHAGRTARPEGRFLTSILRNALRCSAINGHPRLACRGRNGPQPSNLNMLWCPADRTACGVFQFPTQEGHSHEKDQAIFRHTWSNARFAAVPGACAFAEPPRDLGGQQRQWRDMHPFAAVCDIRNRILCDSRRGARSAASMPVIMGC
jgi:hypothetical protein